MNIRRLLWIGCLVGCSRGAAPAKTSPVDEQIGGSVEIETIIRDTTYRTDTVFITEQLKCKPETVYVAKRIKVKDSYNVDNSEVTKLKNAVLIRDSEIQELKTQLGKKCIGEQTNNGFTPKQLILPSIIFMFIFLIIGRLSKLVVGKKLPI